MHAVFLDLQTFSSNVDLTAIEKQVSTLLTYQLTSTDQIIERCQFADIVITNKTDLTAEILKKLPQLKLICIAATGTNNVDLIAAKALRIAVCNVSGYSGNSVAQWVFSQILAYYNQTEHHHQNTENGLWSVSDTFCFHGNNITELSGKTLGLIGYGCLAKSVAHIATAFGMNILIAEREHASTVRADRTAFDEVLHQADIISLHCPQTPETEQLVNTSFLKKMKRSAMLINSARGALVNNEALLNALKNNDIAYAVLDVLDQEPPPENHPLLMAKLNNLKITAHIAWAAQQSQQRLLNGIASNIQSFSLGEQMNRVD